MFSPNGEVLVSGHRHDELYDDTLGIGDGGGGPAVTNGANVLFDTHRDDLEFGCPAAVARGAGPVMTSLNWKQSAGRTRHPVRERAATPDSRRVISVSSDSLRTWDTHTQQPISAAVSPDGHYIVTGGATGLLRRDADTGKPIGELIKVPEIGSHQVTFTRDSRYIISSSYQTIRLWDTESGQAVGGSLHGPLLQIYSVEVSPDNRAIITDGIDGYWLWPAHRPGPTNCAPNSPRT
ncbi:hypothetical protein [Nocardia sp. NPDC004860]|uniref:WD40 repeat domain-containing protein n=1 Tax=Nocardia sp. NPDC004860 TaxID=3154557 RepID=UPI0033AC26E8